MTQVPKGEDAAMRLCFISVAIALLALMGSEWLGKRFARHVEG
jgi:molybdate transport system permease protein